MRAGVVAFGLLLAGGVVAALLLERASAPVLELTGAAAPQLPRPRAGHRGRDRDRAGGAGGRGRPGRRWPSSGVGEELSDSLLRSMVLFACFAFAFLGLIDDLLGTDDDRGFRGHLQALRPRSAHDRRHEAVRRRRWWPSCSPRRPAR